MGNRIRSALLCLLAGASVMCAAFAQDLQTLEQRVELAQGPERLALLAELLEQARDRVVEGVLAKGSEALSLLDEHPDPELELQVRLSLSWYGSRTGDTAAGLQHAERARELAVTRGDRSGIARADYHRAVAHWYRTEHAEASAAARQALTAQKALDEHAELMTTWTLLGAVHRSQSNHDDALACHLEALRLAQQSGQAEDVARARNNIGLVYWDIDEHARAAEYLRQVVPVFRELGKESWLATALSNLGLILIELGEPECALPHLEEALTLHARFGHGRAKAKLLSNLSYAHRELSSIDTAFDYAFRALSLREELGNDGELARSLGSVARLYSDSGRHAEAVDFYFRAGEAAERGGGRDEYAAVQLGLAESYEALGEFESALDAFRKHLEVVKDLDRAATARRIAELESSAQLKAQERQHAAQRAQHSHDLARQRLRLALLAIASVVFLIGLAAAAYINRTRARALAGVRRSHENLERVTKRLMESEERYRRVFEDAVVPKFVVDLDRGRVVDANEPAGLLCGRDPEDLRDRPLDELEPGWLAKIAVADEEGEGGCVERWVDGSGTVRFSELRSAALSLAGRRCAVVTVYDVTARRKSEEDRIRFDRLESLGLLAGGIAHDFNNALTSVLGYVSLARIKNEDSAVERRLADAERGIDHATGLSSQLIAFAKGGEPRRALEDLKQLLPDAVHFSLSGSNVRGDLDVAPNLWAAELDQGQFKQVVSNLVINAAQAMPAGGRLRVGARNVHVERELSAAAGPGRYVRIDFEDEGPGIPAEIQGKILDPYFTTKDHGSGLGLPTVFAIISRHGGWLDFESSPGAGSTFSLYYPASAGQPGTRERDECEVGGSGSILVMDDDPSIHQVLRATLAELGYEVELVEDGRAALASWFRAKDRGRPFDAAIMDLTIPGGMGGKEAMAELRRRDPGAVGIAISGYSKDPVMSDCEAAGFAGALTKPFNVANLGQLLRRVVDSRPGPAYPSKPAPGVGAPSESHARAGDSPSPQGPSR